MTDRRDKISAANIRALGTAVLSDALDRCRIDGVLAGLKPLDPAIDLAGPAYTLRMAPARGGTVGDFIDQVPSGAVIAIDNRGRTNATVWGGLLTGVAVRRGLAGTVIDGACRDTAEIRQHGYPMFCRGTTMRSGKDRVELVDRGGPIEIAGRRIDPGDWLVGDGDGVLTIPAQRLAEVLDAARGIAAAEARISELASGGMTLRQAREAVGYHALQRPPGSAPGRSGEAPS